MLPFPPTHPPCPHLAHPSSCHRGVLELSSLQPMQVIPAYFLPKVVLPGRQMCQKCQVVKSGSPLHITPNICTSWGLQVAPGGFRWFQVVPGGSRRQENPHKYPQLLHILDFERKIVQVAKVHEISRNIFTFNFLSTIFIFRAHLCPCVKL